jgi:hypothetical protein
VGHHHVIRKKKKDCELRFDNPSIPEGDVTEPGITALTKYL